MRLEEGAHEPADDSSEAPDFRLGDGGRFGFAGLCTVKTDDSGELVESCTIITTRPNDLVASVHDRMSVILHATWSATGRHRTSRRSTRSRCYSRTRPSR